MAFVEPAKGRAKIVDLGNEMQIEIPLRPRGTVGWFYWIFLLVFLLAWVFLGFVILGAVFVSPQEKDKPPILFMLGFSLMWLIASVLLGSWCLQLFLGREEILVTPQELRIRRRPFGKQLRYRLPEVKNLRVLEDLLAASGDWLFLWWMWLPYQGVLAFDYGASTVRFGVALDPAEARQIVAAIRKRFGQYMKADETD